MSPGITGRGDRLPLGIHGGMQTLENRQFGRPGGSWGPGGGWNGGTGWDGGWWGDSGNPGDVATFTTTQPQQTRTTTVVVITQNTPTTVVVITTQQPTTQVVVTTRPTILPPPPVTDPESPPIATNPSPSPNTHLPDTVTPGGKTTRVSTGPGASGTPVNVSGPQPSDENSTGSNLSPSATSAGIQITSRSITGSISTNTANGEGIPIPTDGGGNDGSLSTEQDSSVPVGAIVGSIVGALFLMLLALLVWLRLRRKLRREANQTGVYPFHSGGGNTNDPSATERAVPRDAQAIGQLGAQPPTSPPPLPPLVIKGQTESARLPPPSFETRPHPQSSPINPEDVMRAIHTLQAFSPVSEHGPGEEDERVTEAINALQTFLHNRITISDFVGGFNPPPAYQEGSALSSTSEATGEVNESVKQ